MPWGLLCARGAADTLLQRCQTLLQHQAHPAPPPTPHPGAASPALGSPVHHTAMLICCSRSAKPAVSISGRLGTQARTASPRTHHLKGQWA